MNLVEITEQRATDKKFYTLCSHSPLGFGYILFLFREGFRSSKWGLELLLNQKNINFF